MAQSSPTKKRRKSEPSSRPSTTEIRDVALQLLHDSAQPLTTEALEERVVEKCPGCRLETISFVIRRLIEDKDVVVTADWRLRARA